MHLTAYGSKYFAHELTKHCPTDSLERLAAALVDAHVDLNPHQVEAALFAFTSPSARGVILADEVGLGKTIEAGLVLSQKWAERKRRLLVITPSNLRKQWHQELQEKFFLPCCILETKSCEADEKKRSDAPLRVRRRHDLFLSGYLQNGTGATVNPLGSGSHRRGPSPPKCAVLSIPEGQGIRKPWGSIMLRTLVWPD